MPSQGRSAKVCMDEKNVWIFTNLPETNSLLAPENGWQRNTKQFPFGANGLFSGGDVMLVFT